MKRSYAFLIIAVICFAIFLGSWFWSTGTVELASRRELTEPAYASWLTLGNISALCGILSLMIQLWQWRRERA